MRLLRRQAGWRWPVNGLVTGPIGAGKTTVCQRVVAWAQERGYRVRGVLTPAILEGGVKTGIAILDIESGARRSLARLGQEAAGLVVGKYMFDPDVLRWGCAILERAAQEGGDLLLVDEIGPLELAQGGGFVRALDILAAGVFPRTLTVVRETLLGALRRRLPQLQFVEFAVSGGNRQELAGQIVERLWR